MDMNKGVSKKVSGGDWRGIELNWITSGDPENDGWAWRRLRQGGDYCTIVPSVSTTCSVPSISTKSYFVSLCVTNGTQMKWMIKVCGTAHSRGWQGNRRGETESRHQPADQVHYAQNAGKQKQENINISQHLINNKVRAVKCWPNMFGCGESSVVRSEPCAAKITAIKARLQSTQYAVSAQLKQIFFQTS